MNIAGLSVTLYHVDLYRIETERELATLGLDELFAEEGNVVLLEWGEKFPRLVAECDAEIKIERLQEFDRKLTLRKK